MAKKKCIAMLLAGGQGKRLGALTRYVAKPAVSFGGKFRIIDFGLSNCVNFDINTVGVLTQYRPMFLNAYIGTGKAWDLDTADGGVHILPPYMSEQGGTWYKGTANAIYQNLEFINSHDPEHVLIISGDHIYKMDYSDLIRYHEEMEADVTISVIEVPMEEASRFGIMNTDENGRIIEFEEKPANPKSNLASMGIYIFNTKLLEDSLTEDEQNPDSENDFGKNIIPMLIERGKRVFAYKFSGYWKDVGTIDSYYEANMEMLQPEPPFSIDEPGYKVFSNSNIHQPLYIGENAETDNSIICSGCTIEGKVKNSILSPDAVVEEGAVVVDSLILTGAVIKKGAYVKKAIIGEEAVIGEDCVLGIETSTKRHEAGITVVSGHMNIAPGTHILEGSDVLSY
ncbi:MAG: glucose-1-phosphate adenylyltransferase [Clostridiales bacterium]|nr:glucose-1-phosphate adenylyltransferase [Clostridiales bacterium]MBR3842011.1 glucose-1-phosphate adenylyltransferase [Christensenellaceae bacterium]